MRPSTKVSTSTNVEIDIQRAHLVVHAPCSSLPSDFPIVSLACWPREDIERDVGRWWFERSLFKALVIVEGIIVGQAMVVGERNSVGRWVASERPRLRRVVGRESRGSGRLLVVVERTMRGQAKMPRFRLLVVGVAAAVLLTKGARC